MNNLDDAGHYFEKAALCDTRYGKAHNVFKNFLLQKSSLGNDASHQKKLQGQELNKAQQKHTTRCLRYAVHLFCNSKSEEAKEGQQLLNVVLSYGENRIAKFLRDPYNNDNNNKSHEPLQGSDLDASSLTEQLDRYHKQLRSKNKEMHRIQQQLGYYRKKINSISNTIRKSRSFPTGHGSSLNQNTTMSISAIVHTPPAILSRPRKNSPLASMNIHDTMHTNNTTAPLQTGLSRGSEDIYDDTYDAEAASPSISRHLYRRASDENWSLTELSLLEDEMVREMERLHLQTVEEEEEGNWDDDLANTLSPLVGHGISHKLGVATNFSISDTLSAPMPIIGSSGGITRVKGAGTTMNLGLGAIPTVRTEVGSKRESAISSNSFGSASSSYTDFGQALDAQRKTLWHAANSLQQLKDDRGNEEKSSVEWKDTIENVLILLNGSLLQLDHISKTINDGGRPRAGTLTQPAASPDAFALDDITCISRVATIETEQREEFLRDAIRNTEQVDDEDRGVVQHVLQQFFSTKQEVPKTEVFKPILDYTSGEEESDVDTSPIDIPAVSMTSSEGQILTKKEKEMLKNKTSILAEQSLSIEKKYEGKKKNNQQRRKAHRKSISSHDAHPQPITASKRNFFPFSQDTHSRNNSAFAPGPSSTRISMCFYEKKKKRKIRISTREIRVEEKVRRWRSNGNALVMLKKVEEWDFDVFSLCQLCGKYAMAVVFCALCDRRRLLEELSLNVTFLCNFFVEITTQYKDNPYHNYIHGVDVLTNCNYFMRAHVFEGLSNLDVLACLVSAACHDVGHPGNNNVFEIAVESDLAVKYNDESVLENMHAAKTWEVMKKPGCNILEEKSKTERKRFRQLLIQSILATDMNKHKEQMGALTKLIDELNKNGRHLEKWSFENGNDNMKSPHLALPNKSLEVTSSATVVGGTAETVSIFDRKAELAGILIPLAVHTGDLCNPTKPLRIYRQWANRITQEFYEQGDKEKQLGIPITAAFDRTQTTLPAGQTGFINHVIKPWFDLWGKLLPEKNQGVLLNDNTNLNLEYMKKELELAKKEKERKSQQTPLLSYSQAPAVVVISTDTDESVQQHPKHSPLPSKSIVIKTPQGVSDVGSASKPNSKPNSSDEKTGKSFTYSNDSSRAEKVDLADPHENLTLEVRMSFQSPRTSKAHSILAASPQDIKNAQLEKHLLAIQELNAEQITEMENDYDMFTPEEDSVSSLRNFNFSRTKKPPQQRLKIGAYNTTSAISPHAYSPSTNNKNINQNSPLQRSARTNGQGATGGFSSNVNKDTE
ncbi:hypothetical protein RFI_07025 [Reticulomyxa filosa]|uniref:Phosphodiesterase n=1 Tax=Reticulomyxa filosa TaxID=46433 RepID=X6NUW2_RETFI|nr:hypothetical protein RFI_07025 [Reticulomyxa filosa]|eukprot:ETO30095.1 hypothetical protein RFI_07025 [Reticulomyxa filosa]